MKTVADAIEVEESTILEVNSTNPMDIVTSYLGPDDVSENDEKHGHTNESGFRAGLTTDQAGFGAEHFSQQETDTSTYSHRIGIQADLNGNIKVSGEAISFESLTDETSLTRSSQFELTSQGDFSASAQIGFEYNKNPNEYKEDTWQVTSFEAKTGAGINFGSREDITTSIGAEAKIKISNGLNNVFGYAAIETDGNNLNQEIAVGVSRQISQSGWEVGVAAVHDGHDIQPKLATSYSFD